MVCRTMHSKSIMIFCINLSFVNNHKCETFYPSSSVPNLKTVRELIYKRGYGKVNHQRIPLTDNAIIEKELGKVLYFKLV